MNFTEDSSRLITAIVSNESRLYIYENSNIIWAAQSPFPAPIAIRRSNLNGLPGAIITLEQTGALHISYLGSDAFVFKVPPLNTSEITLGQAQKELQQIEDEIKEAVDIQDMDSLNQKAYDDVRLYFSIASTVHNDLDTLLLEVPANVAVKEFPSCSAELKIRTKIDIHELQITFNMPEGIRCSQESRTLTQLPTGTTEDLRFDFYIADLLHIHTARIEVIVSYISATVRKKL